MTSTSFHSRFFEASRHDKLVGINSGDFSKKYKSLGLRPLERTSDSKISGNVRNIRQYPTAKLQRFWSVKSPSPLDKGLFKTDTMAGQVSGVNLTWDV